MAATTTRDAYVPSRPYGLHIGGEEIAAAERFEAIDPSVGTPWAEIPQASVADVDRAVEAALAAFPAWRRTSLATRQELLWRLADAVEADPQRWARLLATENGRPIREATIADVPTCAAILRFYAGVVRDLRGDQIPVDAPDSLVYTVREPLGVIAALIPWNSPIITLANKLGPALAAGNTVVVKPSEYASASVLELARLAQEILPPGVVNVVTGFGPSVGAALVAHRDVAKVTFTGGTATARKIMAAAGEALTPAIMELGGKGAMIVCADADLDAAVADALTGIYMANGEVCVAASRLLVHSSVHDAFAERFAAVARTIRIGDALDPATQFGPLVSAQQRDRVAAAVAQARAEGAEVVVGGEAPALQAPLDGGYFLAPTLLADAAGGTSASREEFFGPVTVLERFDDEAEAVTRANATRYGLAAGVWTRDLARAHRVARELEAGIVWVNKWFDLAIGVPMGGVKDSGFGRELSAETLHEYSAPKVVNLDLSTARPRLWGEA
ncbi:MAG TPA: aldehyde dehydrogenase family protein [Conexibacter sp.]|jgi:aldehyde dehydrogenase (NAD+)